MSETAVIALFGGAVSILTALIGYLAQVKTARIAAEANKASSQAGAVGEERVRNQVSPRPPDRD
jgi:hypothetical protein